MNFFLYALANKKILMYSCFYESLYMTGFSDKQIVSLLGIHSLWSKRACREILRRPSDFVPELIDILDKTVHDPESLEGDDLHIPAAMLLAQIREPLAYPLLVKLISYNEESVDSLWGDILTDHYTEILRDTFNEDSSLLSKLIENRSAAPWARAMAIRALGMHYFDGHIGREEITGYFRRLIHEVYTGELNFHDETVLSYIADCVREHQFEELMEDVETVFARNGIDEIICGNCEEYMTGFYDPLYGLLDKHMEDTSEVLDKWHWFEEDTSDDDDYDDDELPMEKIGRNEPCPCGSGKKYKNCCLNPEE